MIGRVRSELGKVVAMTADCSRRTRSRVDVHVYVPTGETHSIVDATTSIVVLVVNIERVIAQSASMIVCV